MPDLIFDARTILGVKTAREYAKKQAQAIAKQVTRGIPVELQTVSEPVFARVEQNRWLVDCYCGSGVAAHPEWDARCLGIGCGRVYTNVQFPVDCAAIEQVLTARPGHVNRNWTPGETVEDLVRENVERGVRP